MALRSCLDERPAPVVADTSVVINLNATGCSEAILGALPNPCVVPEEVSLELQAGRRTGRGDADTLAVLVEQHLVEPAGLGDAGMSQFADLVGGAAADTLDDGEAATIACAVERSAIALIDDRKAIRICAERFPHLAVGCTVDVLAQQHVQAALGHHLPDAVFNALDGGRMRVRCGTSGGWSISSARSEPRYATRCRNESVPGVLRAPGDQPVRQATARRAP